jgi:hypothetical protein
MTGVFLGENFRLLADFGNNRSDFVVRNVEILPGYASLGMSGL